MRAARKYLNMILEGTEVVLSIFLVAALAVLTVKLFITTFFSGSVMNEETAYYIEKAMNLAIGIEFAKMLFHHTPETVIEVLLFAISRHMIVQHPTAVETLLGVLAIAVLFAVKKYLMTSFRDQERIICPGQITVRKLELRYGISLPADGSRMLCDVLREHLRVQNLPVEAGICFSLADATVKIEEMQNGRIKTVEITKVRSIFDE